MALILQLETATSSCSVAVAEHGRLLTINEVDAPNVHGQQLTLFIEDALAAAGKTLNDLSAVAVSRGPGSYTGLRIGVSVAKGICFALDIPLISVDTLLAMAAGFADGNFYPGRPSALLCPMIDARRMEVYTAVYESASGAMKALRPVEALVIDENSFAGFGARELVFFGDGAAKCKEVLGGENRVFIDGFRNSAAAMSRFAYSKFDRGEFEDLAYFEPYYLKDFYFKKA